MSFPWRTTLALAASLLPLGACSSTTARWTAGATLVSLEEPPWRRPSEVSVHYKQAFSAFETTGEKLPRACHSVTLLRRMGLIPGAPAAPPPGGAVEVLAQLTTDEYPRDDEASRTKGSELTRVLGMGNDELDLFEVVPAPSSIERGVARLREMAAALGADELREVFYTGYAEHQMWEGTTLSVTPTRPSSPFYVHARLLDFRLRDVRFHGTAVRRRGPG